MNYSKIVKEYVKVRMEQTDNNTLIAKEVRDKFNPPKELDSIRRWISHYRQTLQIKAAARPIKRLFFDVETSYYTCRLWRIGKTDYISPDTIISQKQIICIAYKWQYEDDVHILDWSKGEKAMLKSFIKVLEEADEIIGHNGDRFDIKELRTRCIYYGIPMFPAYRTLDTLLKARQYFNFASNKLDYIGKYLNVGKKLDHEGLQMWIDVVENKDKKALERMKDYCMQDVILLEDVFFAMSPYILHNNNFAVLTGGDKWHCPECASDNVLLDHTYATAMGTIKRNMKCTDCGKQYKVSNRTYMKMLEKIIK
jgi:DNA polymerase elongation subunit (family B)